MAPIRDTEASKTSASARSSPRPTRARTFTRLGETLFASTTLAPILLVLAARQVSPAWTSLPAPSGLVLAGVGATLLALSWAFIAIVRRRTVPEPLTVTELKPADRDVLGFVLAYLIPAVALDVTNVNVLALVVAVAFSVAILVHTDSLHVNPMVALQGYRFFEIQDKSGLCGLLLTRDRTAARLVDFDGRKAWQFHVVRLTDTVWLHTPSKE